MFPTGKTVNTSTPLPTDTKETQPGVSTTEVFRIRTGLEKKISSGLPGQVDILNEETTFQTDLLNWKGSRQVFE